MFNKPAFIISLCLLVFSALPVSAATVKEIKSYGVYVAGKDGYTKVRPYKHTANNFVEFKYLHELATVKRTDKKLKLIVYQKDFNQDRVAFRLQPMQNTIKVDDVKFDIAPLDKADMYELTLEQDVADGTALLVGTSAFYDYNFGAIMLGDIQAYLEKYFNDSNNGPYYASLSNVRESAAAFPKNKKLKELVKKWEVIAAREKDKKDYEYVDTAWRKYEGATKLKLQARYLRNVIREVNGYLQNHPKGSKVGDANKRKSFAEKKLKEIEKLL